VVAVTASFVVNLLHEEAYVVEQVVGVGPSSNRKSSDETGKLVYMGATRKLGIQLSFEQAARKNRNMSEYFPDCEELY
jgi:hypothetical protein